MQLIAHDELLTAAWEQLQPGSTRNSSEASMAIQPVTNLFAVSRMHSFIAYFPSDLRPFRSPGSACTMKKSVWKRTREGISTL